MYLKLILQITGGFLLLISLSAYANRDNNALPTAGTLIDRNIQAPLCMDPHALTFSYDPACLKKQIPATNRQTQPASNRLMQVPPFDDDRHFYNVFMLDDSTQFNLDELTKLVNNKNTKKYQHIPFLFTYDYLQITGIGKKIGWDSNLAKMRTQMLSRGLQKIINTIPHKLDHYQKQWRTKLRCAAHNPNLACQKKLFYTYIVLGDQPPAQVYAQLLAGFELAKHDPRVNEINLLTAKDGFYSTKDHELHLQMISYLRKLYPKIHIKLNHKG